MPKRPTKPRITLIARAAKGAADRAGSAIDDALASIAASNKRIGNMEAAAAKIPASKVLDDRDSFEPLNKS